MNQHSKVSRCELLLEQYPVDVQNCEKSLPPLLIEGLILAVANKCKIFEISPQYLHRCIIYIYLLPFSSWSFYPCKSIPCHSRLVKRIHRKPRSTSTTSCGASRGKKQTVPHHIHVPNYSWFQRFWDFKRASLIYYIYPKIDHKLPGTIAMNTFGI